MSSVSRTHLRICGKDAGSRVGARHEQLAIVIGRKQFGVHAVHHGRPNEGPEHLRADVGNELSEHACVYVSVCESGCCPMNALFHSKPSLFARLVDGSKC